MAGKTTRTLFFILYFANFAFQNPKSLAMNLEGGLRDLSYSISIGVGSARVAQRVIIDTGSSTLFFPCGDETNSGKDSSNRSSVFNIFRSKSFEFDRDCGQQSRDKSKPCLFYNYFKEGSSVDGFSAKDFVCLRGSEPADASYFLTKAKIGCTTHSTGKIAKDATVGVLGLAKDSSLFGDLESKYSQRLNFAVCLAQSGGQFSVGTDVQLDK